MQDLNNFDNIIHKYNYKLEHELSKKLTIYANNFLQTNFNIELYAKIYFNNSLKQVKGRTIFESNKEGYNEIELSGELLNLSLLDPKKYDYLYDVLNHELVHYALYVLNKKFSDGEDDFENTLRKLNIGSSGSTKDYKKFGNKVREYRTYMHMNCGLINGWYAYQRGMNKKYPEYKIDKAMILKEEL